MGQLLEINEALRNFINAQHMFFVATAPAGPGGHINLSPKGGDTFRILDPSHVAYLDQVGSGAETIAHLRENGRITLMFCAFEGAPKILRLYGTGTVVEPQDSEFAMLKERFGEGPGVGVRSIIRVQVERVADSCGFGVPLYGYQGERTRMREWCEQKGSEGLIEYQRKKNRVSLDGLPALRWVQKETTY